MNYKCAKEVLGNVSSDNLLKEMRDVWNACVNEEYFLKPFSYEGFKNHMITNPHFDFDFVYLCFL